MKNLAVLFLLLVGAVTNASAQTITIASLSGTLFCTGDSVDVAYEATGSYTNRNSFTVQLSDEFGKFDKFFYNLVSKRTTSSSSLRFGVPALVSSNNYRIRVISSEPYIVGATHPASLTLSPKPRAGAMVGSNRNYMVAVLVDQPLQIKNASQYADSYLWEFGPDANPATSTEKDPTVRFSTPGKKEAKLTAFSLSGCSSEWRTIDNKNHEPIMIQAVTCLPQIPSSAAVDSTISIEPFTNQDIWVVPGGQAGADYVANYYVEPGATFKSEADYLIVYLKAGAAYFGEYNNNIAIVYEEGAGLKGIDDEQLILCPNLEFDYSDAPPYKIKPSSVSRVSGSTIQVYPNPTTDRLTIEHADNIIREISLRNTLGAEQLFMHPEGLGKTSIDVSHLAAGLYFLDLITDRGIETHKIVVE
jgi:PKD repeat protein